MMITKMWTKKQTQEVIKGLRASEYVVNKINSGYKCKVGKVLVFRALNGSNGYLVKYDERLFS